MHITGTATDKRLAIKTSTVHLHRLTMLIELSCCTVALLHTDIQAGVKCMHQALACSLVIAQHIISTSRAGAANSTPAWVLSVLQGMSVI